MFGAATIWGERRTLPSCADLPTIAMPCNTSAVLLTAPKLFVFSDDIPWCRSAFAGTDVAFVDVNGPDDAVDDLRLMAACRHHIIANSSLSWWGAWLAHHPEQVVIAPQPWLPGADSDRDLLPPHWIKLPKT